MDDKRLVEMLEQKPSLNRSELQSYMDATIRSRARWKARSMRADEMGGELVDGDAVFDESKVDAVAQWIHDDIVTDFSYNENLLKASRAIQNFGSAYVAGVIKRAIKAKQITVEHAFVSGAMTEAAEKAGLGKVKVRRRRK